MDFFKHFFRNGNNSEPFNFSQDTHQFPNDESSRQGFDFFSDTVRIHEYFENEIGKLLESFGFNMFGTSEFHDFSTILPPPNNEEHGQSLRDHFLKEGYQKNKPDNYSKVDQDLDEKVKSSNLDSLLTQRTISDVQASLNPSNSFFSSHKQTFKTIALPDGTVKTERCIADSQGNEETTVCHKMGDKEYCVIKRKNKTGEVEVTEKLTNIDENEKNEFIKAYDNLKDDQSKNFPFNLFS